MILSASVLYRTSCRILAAVLWLCCNSAAMAGPASQDSFAHPLSVVDGRRIALIIGNTAYPSDTNWRPLPKAASDAGRIADLLSDPARGAARFEVKLLEDAKYADIKQAVAAFALLAKSADIALIFYSGHGFEYGKTNFIVPIDAPSTVRRAELTDHFIDMEAIARDARARGLNMIFLDACRSRVPVVQRDAPPIKEPASAFAAIQAPESIVMYASSPGGVAYDEAPPGSPLSPFAQALVYGMTRQGMDMGLIMPLVARYVGEATSERARPQLPQVQGSWTKLFYFLPETPNVAPGPPPTPAQHLVIPADQLNTIDEPMLIPPILAAHPPSEIRSLAEDGDPLALYILGYMYSYGLSVPANREEAEKWLSRAAATGHPAGQLEYGYFLLNKSNRPGDKDKARDLYEKAAAQGYAKAQTHLGIALINGQFGPSTAETNQRARGLLAQAVQRGYVSAIAAFSFFNPTEGHNALTRLAAQGNLDADHWLCRSEAITSQFALAAPHCIKAAEGLYVNAQAQLALLYQKGQGVAPSPELARHWARIAFSQQDLDDDLRKKIAPLAN